MILAQSLSAGRWYFESPAAKAARVVKTKKKRRCCFIGLVPGSCSNPWLGQRCRADGLLRLQQRPTRMRPHSVDDQFLEGVVSPAERGFRPMQA